MNIWNIVSQAINSPSVTYQTLFLPKQRVDISDETYGEPIKPGTAYCRLVLVEMRLAKTIDWFTKRYPVVYSAIRFEYGDGPVTIPHVAGPGFLRQLTQQNLDRIIQSNHALTPLFPYNRGLVELQAGLFSLKTGDSISSFMTTLGRFAKLLPVPELSTVLKLVDPVYTGIQELLQVGDSHFEIGYQQTFSGADSASNHLRPGYLAVILAEDNQLDKETLCVINDSLRIGAPGKAKEFLKLHHNPVNYSYMLFRLETKKEQDWEGLTEIKQLVHQGFEALGNQDNNAFNLIWASLKYMIWTSRDLTKADRKGMLTRLKQAFREFHLETTPRGPLSLYAVMQRPLPPPDAELTAELADLETISR